MIVTMTETAVVAFSPEQGTVLWQHPYENARQNHPITPIYHRRPALHNQRLRQGSHRPADC